MSIQVNRGIIPFLVDSLTGEIVGYQLRDGRMAYFGAAVQITSVLDGEAPVADEDLIASDTVTVSGTGTPGYTAVIWLNGKQYGDTPVASNGTWTIEVSDLSQGENAIGAQALDPSGAPAGRTPPFVFHVDSVAPAAATNLVINEDGDTLTGVAEPGATVEAFDGDEVSLGSATAAGDGAFTITLDPAQDPEAVVTVVVTDEAGNESAAETVAVPAAPEE